MSGQFGLQAKEASLAQTHFCPTTILKSFHLSFGPSKGVNWLRDRVSGHRETLAIESAQEGRQLVMSPNLRGLGTATNWLVSNQPTILCLLAQSIFDSPSEKGKQKFDVWFLVSIETREQAQNWWILLVGPIQSASQSLFLSAAVLNWFVPPHLISNYGLLLLVRRETWLGVFPFPEWSDFLLPFFALARLFPFENCFTPPTNQLPIGPEHEKWFWFAIFVSRLKP